MTRFLHQRIESGIQRSDGVVGLTEGGASTTEGGATVPPPPFIGCRGFSCRAALPYDAPFAVVLRFSNGIERWHFWGRGDARNERPCHWSTGAAAGV